MKTKEKIWTGLLLLLIVTLFNNSTIAQSTMVINSDATWNVSPTFTTGWETPGFNASGWGFTVAPALAGNNCGYTGGTVAPQNMWINNGTDTDIYLRKTFTISKTPTSAFIKAIFDDNGTIFINGQQVYNDHDNTIVTATDTLPVNVLPFLTCGENVIAMHAWDGLCCCWMAEVQLKIELDTTPLTASIANFTAVTCHDSCNGTANVSVTSGICSPQYSYSWSSNPVQTSASAIGLCAGTYTCTVTDSSSTLSGIELVSNGDFSFGNTGFSSAYVFTSNNTTEGEYFVGTSTQVSTWNGGLTSLGDHTGGGGKLLMVNGAPAANTNIWCQTISTTANTNYQFSSWLSTLYTTNPAQLQFSINNSPIGSIFTAPTTTGVWSQFSTLWNSGINTTASICILNQNTAIAGNDFGIDDISFQAYSLPQTDTVSVTITEPAELIVNPITPPSICSGSSVTLNANVYGGNGGYNYLWTPGSFGNSSSINVSPKTSTTYSVNVTDSKGCSGDESVLVSINSAPTANFTVTSTDCSTAFENTSTDAVSYLWDFGDGTSSSEASPSHTYVTQNVYTITLKAVNTEGCEDTTSATVKINASGSSFFMPNAFTPNGDNINDVFKVANSGLGEFNATIFNRWGEIIYQWSSPTEGWDGTIKGSPVADGVYAYIVKAKLLCNDISIERKGMVTLMR